MVLWGHGAQLCSFRLGDSDVVMVSWLLGWVSWSLDRVGHPRWFTHMPNRWRWPSARTSAGAGDHRKTCDPSMWLECLTVCHLGSTSKHSKIPWGELQRFFPSLENHTTLLPPQFTCQNWVTGPAQIRREGTIYTRAWILAMWLMVRAEGHLWTPATTHPETTIHSWVKNWGWFCIWLAWDCCKSCSPVSPT